MPEEGRVQRQGQVFEGRKFIKGSKTMRQRPPGGRVSLPLAHGRQPAAAAPVVGGQHHSVERHKDEEAGHQALPLRARHVHGASERRAVGGGASGGGGGSCGWLPRGLRRDLVAVAAPVAW